MNKYKILIIALLCVMLSAVSLNAAPREDTPVYLPVISNPQSTIPQATDTTTPSPTPTATQTSTPTATTVSTPTQTPTPTTPPPGDVYIRSQRHYWKDTSLYIVGEVVNGTSVTQYFVKVIGRFYNSANELVATEDTYAYLTATMPSQRNPFKMIVFNVPEDVNTYQLSLDWDSEGGLDYRQITVISQNTRDNFGIEVFGEIRNDHAEMVKSVSMAVSFYDDNDEVIDVDFGFPSVTELAPGATSPYSILTFEDITFAAMNVQAQGYLEP